MRSNEYVTNEVFSCPCNSDEHRIAFSLFDYQGKDKPDENWPAEDRYDLTVSVYLCNYRGFWRRLWAGLQYVCGKFTCRHGHFDCGTISYDDAERLIRVVQAFKNKVDLAKEVERKKVKITR